MLIFSLLTYFQYIMYIIVKYIVLLKYIMINYVIIHKNNLVKNEHFLNFSFKGIRV